MNRFTGLPSERGQSEPPEYYMSAEEIDRLTYTEEERFEIWKAERGFDESTR